jgi:hypothetical protein
MTLSTRWLSCLALCTSTLMFTVYASADSDKGSQFKKTFIPSFVNGNKEIYPAEVEYRSPKGKVKYILFEGAPGVVSPAGKEKDANALVQAMIKFSDDPRIGLDLSANPFPGVTFDKKHKPGPGNMNCFGYAVTAALGKGQAFMLA